MPYFIGAVLQADLTLTAFNNIWSGAAGIVLGFLASIALFRSRFTSLEKDLEFIKERYAENRKADSQENAKEWERLRDDVARACGGEREWQRNSERRQIATLQLLAVIAKKEGLTHRAPEDTLTRLLAETEKDHV